MAMEKGRKYSGEMLGCGALKRGGSRDGDGHWPPEVVKTRVGYLPAIYTHRQIRYKLYILLLNNK